MPANAVSETRKAKTIKGFALYRNSVKEAIPQLRGVFNNGYQNTKDWATEHKVQAAFTAAAGVGAIGAGVYFAGPGMAAIQALGFAGHVVGLAAGRLKYNRHTRAIGTLNAPVMMSHHLLMGASSTALMSSFGVARALTFSMMPESWTTARRTAAITYAAVGLPTMFFFSMHNSWWGLFNMAAMAGGIGADLMISSPEKKNDTSRYARLSRVWAAGWNMAYDVLHSHSLSGMAFNAISVGNSRSAIKKYDIAVKDQTGRPLTAQDSTFRYLRSVFCNEPVQGLTPDEIEQREKNKTASPGLPAALVPSLIQTSNDNRAQPQNVKSMSPRPIP